MYEFILFFFARTVRVLHNFRLQPIFVRIKQSHIIQAYRGLLTINISALLRFFITTPLVFENLHYNQRILLKKNRSYKKY